MFFNISSRRKRPRAATSIDDKNTQAFSSPQKAKKCTNNKVTILGSKSLTGQLLANRTNEVKTSKDDAFISNNGSPLKKVACIKQASENGQIKLVMTRSPQKEKHDYPQDDKKKIVRCLKFLADTTYKEQTIVISADNLPPPSTPRGKSQNAVMKNNSAQNYTKAHNENLGRTAKMQWLHICGHMLGGDQLQSNLVAGTWACNMVMLSFEYLIRRLLEEKLVDKLTITFKAWLKNGSLENPTHMATKIAIIINNKTTIQFYPNSDKELSYEYKTCIVNLFESALRDLADLDDEKIKTWLEDASKLTKEDKEDYDSIQNTDTQL